MFEKKETLESYEKSVSRFACEKQMFTRATRSLFLESRGVGVKSLREINDASLLKHLDNKISLSR
jgi:hypothetical protein